MLLVEIRVAAVYRFHTTQRGMIIDGCYIYISLYPEINSTKLNTVEDGLIFPLRVIVDTNNNNCVIPPAVSFSQKVIVPSKSPRFKYFHICSAKFAAI